MRQAAKDCAFRIAHQNPRHRIVKLRNFMKLRASFQMSRAHESMSQQHIDRTGLLPSKLAALHAIARGLATQNWAPPVQT